MILFLIKIFPNIFHDDVFRFNKSFAFNFKRVYSSARKGTPLTALKTLRLYIIPKRKRVYLLTADRVLKPKSSEQKRKNQNLSVPGRIIGTGGEKRKFGCRANFKILPFQFQSRTLAGVPTVPVPPTHQQPLG